MSNRHMKVAQRPPNPLDGDLRLALDYRLDCCGIYSAIRGADGRIVDFRVEYVNAAVRQGNPIAGQEQVGKRLSDVLPSQIMSALFGAYCRVVDTGKPFIRERFEYRDAYGDSAETRAFAIQVTKFRDGILASWRPLPADTPAIAVASDAAQTMAIRRERDRAQQYLDVTSVMMVGLDREGRVVLANRKTCEVLGYAEADILGKDWFEHFLPQRYRREVRNVFRQIVAGKRSAVEFHENPVLTASGEERTIDWHNAEVRDEDGRIVGTLGSGTDITRQERAEAALRESEARFRATFEQAAVGMAQMSADGRWLRVNEKLCEILGYSREELLQKTFQEVTHPEDLAADLEHAERLVAGAITTYSIEKRYLRKDGAIVWAHLTVSPLRFPRGEIPEYTAIIKDISDRKEAEAALRASEERLRAIVMTAADAIITIDEAGIIQSFNPAAERMFGYAAKDVSGRNVRLLMPPPYNEEHDGYISRFLRTGEARIIGIGREVTARRKDGSTFPADLAISQVDHLGLFTGIVRDISERKRMQEEVLRAAEEEQRRIGQELHDDAQQQLTGLAMLARSLALYLSDDSAGADEPAPLAGGQVAPGLAEKADYLAHGINSVNRHIQLLARGLIPSEMEAHGLPAALAELARNTSELLPILCRFEGDESIEVPDNFVATHLYRIAQEALNNAVKHANADEVVMRLDRTDGGIRLVLQDDGVGITSNLGTENGRGVHIMRCRADLIGAVLRIGQAETRGTEVCCTLPTLQ